MENNDDLKSNWDNSSPSKLTIGGQAFDPHNACDDVILSTIKALPGSLSKRARISTDGQYNPVPPAATDEYAAYKASNQFAKHGNLNQLQESIEHYISAAEQYEKMELLQPAANMYSLAAQQHIMFPYNVFENNTFLSEKAVAIYDKAIKLHDLQGHEDLSYRDRDKLYNAIAETVLAYRAHWSAELSKEERQIRETRYYDRLEPEASELLYSSRRIQGMLDNTALRVEQKEIGISDGKDIGTDNVSQCVTLIVRSCGKDSELETPVVALAHIDYQTDAKSIAQIFEHLPAGNKEARILGARFDKDPKSLENLVKVIKALAAYKVDIISSNVYQGDQGPSTVVVNPLDFSMRESVPAANKDMAEASCAYSLMTEDKIYPLRLAFDTRNGKNRTPLYLTQSIVRKIRENYLNRDYAQRYVSLRDEGLFDIGLSNHFCNSLVKQYEKAIEDLLPHATTQLPNPVIEDMPIYIGKNALAKNIAVVEEMSRAYQQGENVKTFDYETRMQPGNVVDQSSDAHPNPR